MTTPVFGGFARYYRQILALATTEGITDLEITHFEDGGVHFVRVRLPSRERVALGRAERGSDGAEPSGPALMDRAYKNARDQFASWVAFKRFSRAN